MKKQFTINTSREKEIIPITEEINRMLSEMKAGDGIVLIQVMHTTCAVTTADLDPGTDRDYLNAIEKIFPDGKWNHPHDPAHVGDHIMSSLVGPSVVIDVNHGKLELGTWQTAILIELSGPRTRNLSLTFIPDK